MSEKSKDMDAQPAHLRDVLDDLREDESGGKVSVDDILDALAHRSFGPLLLVPALIAALPVVGALPGVSYTMAALCFFISVQFALSKPKLWVPGSIRDIDFDREGFDKGLDKARPLIRWIDRLVVPRFKIAFHEPMPRLIALLCVAVSVLMVIYASVPGGVIVPAVALILLGLGLTTHDGFVVSLGIIAGAITIGGTFWIVSMVI